jgi:hypothetical protein
MVRGALIPVLEQECSARMPPPASFNAPSQIYFGRMHPIFPVVNENLYHSLQSTDLRHIGFAASHMLGASHNFVARPHLLLGNSELPLSCKEFGDRVSEAMRLYIESGLVSSKIILIQALALISQL